MKKIEGALGSVEVDPLSSMLVALAVLLFDFFGSVFVFLHEIV